jgi:hypothetical protein
VGVFYLHHKVNLLTHGVSLRSTHSFIILLIGYSVMNELFGGRIVNNLPHIPAGFISKQAVLPADFCEMGINRFRNEFNGLPSHIQDEIKDSLKVKLEELKNINLVVPTSLEYLITS